MEGGPKNSQEKYFSVHHRFLAWIGRITKTIILVPHPKSIGNASEDYYFGLLLARKLGKKLVVLFPFQMPSRLKMQRWFDPAILFLESELLAFKYRGAMSTFLSGLFTLYFIVARVMAMCLHKLFRMETSGYYWRPLAGQDLLWRPNPNVTKFEWELSRNQSWETELSRPLRLSLPENMVAACESECNLIGLPLNAQFVCLHVREGGYSGDWDNFRNSNVSNYLGAIREMTGRGLWVIRMGDATMTKLPILDRVIDYAFTPSRSATMDVYLLMKCSFYVGTSSGITDTAMLLGKPVVLTNMTSWINLLPQNYGDLTIFKHAYSRSEQRYISIKEWLSQASNITTDNLSSPDWQLVENTEDEITAVVKNKMDFNKSHGPTRNQREFKTAVLHAAMELSNTIRFGSTELENCNEWFRFASRILTWRGEISADFLERNWLRNSRTHN